MNYMQIMSAFDNTGVVAASSSGSTAASMEAGNQKGSDALRTELDKDAFFMLLITQMRHQDPLSPMENTEFIAQIAQFTSLEQMSNLNETMENYIKIQAISQGSSLIGKTIETLPDENGNFVKGRVKGVSYEDGELYLYLEDTDQRLHIDNVIKVY